MKKQLLQKLQCEIRYGVKVKLVNLANERPILFDSEVQLAFFIRDNGICSSVSNLKCLPVRLQGIAVSEPSKLSKPCQQ